MKLRSIICLTLLTAIAPATFAQISPIVVSGGVIAAPPGACTPASGYSHCRVLTVDHTQVGASAFTGAVWIETTLGSSRLQNANCYDVVYASDSTSTTLLPWEPKTCNQSTGAVGSWVLCPSPGCSNTVDTPIYVSYQNAAISTAQNTGGAAPTNVWSSAHKGVWHLGDGTTLSVADSTSNANASTNHGVTATTGQIDGAGNFNGSSQYIEVADGSPLNFTGDISIAAWVYPTTLGSYVEVVAKGPVNPLFRQYLMDMDNSSPSHVRFCLYYSSSEHCLSTASTLAVNTWHMLVGTRSGSAVTLYVDGVSDATATMSGTLMTSTDILAIGRLSSDSSGYWPGKLDEIRILDAAYTAAEITAMWNNQKSGSTFVTMGSEI